MNPSLNQVTNPDLSQLILLGVISGVLATFLSWLFSRFLTDTIVPWYQKRVYRGIIVSGAWSGQRTDGDTTFGFKIDLRQNGHELEGRFTAENKRNGGTVSTTKFFYLRGEITNSCVLLRYFPADPQVYGSGAFLLHVFDGGRVLKGGMLYFQTRTGRIGAVDDIEVQRALG